MDVDSFATNTDDASTGGKRKRTLDGSSEVADLGGEPLSLNTLPEGSGQGRMGLMERRESGKVSLRPQSTDVELTPHAVHSPERDRPFVHSDPTSAPSRASAVLASVFDGRLAVRLLWSGERQRKRLGVWATVSVGLWRRAATNTRLDRAWQRRATSRPAPSRRAALLADTTRSDRIGRHDLRRSSTPHGSNAAEAVGDGLEGGSGSCSRRGHVDERRLAGRDASSRG